MSRATSEPDESVGPPAGTAGTDTAADPGPRVCPNCGTAAPGNYCPECGQSSADVRVSVRRLLADAVDDYFNVNAALPRTLRLLLRPGRLTTEYLAGRRARYLPPLRLYLATSFIYFFVFFGIADGGRPEDAEPGSQVQIELGDDVDLDIPFLTAAQQERLERRLRAIGDMEAGSLDTHIRSEMAARTPIAVFLLVPVFAALLRLAWGRTRRYYAEHFILAMHIHAFAFLGFSVMLLVPWSSVSSLVGLAIIAYVIAALRHVYGQSLPRTVLKFTLISLIYGILLVFSIVVIVLAAFLTAPV